MNNVDHVLAAALQLPASSPRLRVETARAREKIVQWVICKLERIRASERAALDLLSPRIRRARWESIGGMNEGSFAGGDGVKRGRGGDEAGQVEGAIGGSESRAMRSSQPMETQASRASRRWRARSSSVVARTARRRWVWPMEYGSERRS